jgi:hypothetical protein
VVDRVHHVTGITPLTPVPETSMDLPHRVGLFVKPIHKILADPFLTTVTSVLDGNVVSLRNSRQASSTQ